MSARPRKRFGQHFLHDPYVIERIVDALDPRPGQRLVEIGPGRGALTFRVLERCGELHVVELDRDLAAELRQARSDAAQLHVHESDALRFDFGSLAAPRERLRVFGNLPYNISTPLLFHLLEHAPDVSDMLFMLQREVVERMTATPGNKRYGRLTVMLAIATEVEKLFTVGPGAFTPPPKVDSAIVRLRPHRQRLDAGTDPAVLATLVTQAFGQRRKTLRNALRGHVESADIEAAGLDPMQRPETVDPQGFVALAHTLTGARLLK